MKTFYHTIALCMLTLLMLSSCKPENSFPSPLKDVAVSNQTFRADETERTITLNSRLTDVAAKATDLADNEIATWVTVTVDNTKIQIKLQENITINDRKARVHLYYAGNRSDIEDADVTVDFYVTQKKNEMFENMDITEIETNHLQRDTTISTKVVLNNIKVTTSDLEGNPASWCNVRASGNDLLVNVSENKDNSTRVALVRLEPNSKVVNIDSLLAKKIFVVRQLKNPVLDSLNIEEVQLSYESTKTVVHMGRELKGIKALIADQETKMAVNWCKATVAGDSVTFLPNLLKTKDDRTATVTLYLPNKGDGVIDTTTIAYSFRIKQNHNDQLDGLDIKQLAVAYNQANDTVKTSRSLKGMKVKLFDTQTEKIPVWLQATVADSAVVLKFTKNTAKADRTAQVTLYLPNNGDVIDNNSVQTSFTVEQLHNDIFDSITIDNRTVKYNQTADTLRMSRVLSDIRCQIIDDATKLGANWISAKISGKEVIFTPKVNSSLNARSATVTLYMLDGANVESSSVKTSFKITQDFKPQVKIIEKRVDVDYTEQNVDIHVNSNVKYQIEVPGTWVKGVLKLIDENNEIITLVFPENKTNEKHEGNLRLLVNGEEMAKIPLSQLTNPKIEFNFEDQRKTMSFPKAGGEFNLPIKTLTPGYKISKKGTWISIASATTEGIDKYYHKVSVPYFAGNAFERHDTIVISNFKDTISFPILQHKYIYLNEAQKEVEEGTSFKLIAKTNTNHTIQWTSTRTDIATVDQEGNVNALDKHTLDRDINDRPSTVEIKASIGNYAGQTDYNDFCTVTIYTAPDKVDVKRGSGNYEKTENLVTSDCPVVITNNYHATIQIQSLTIEGRKNGSNVNFTLNVKDDDNEYLRLKKGTGHTFALPDKLVGIYQPIVKLTFTVNGTQYTKKMKYYN